jgi:hypothetical protein
LKQDLKDCSFCFDQDQLKKIFEFLLISQRFDRIEMSGFARGVVTEKYSNGGREQKAAEDCED